MSVFVIRAALRQGCAMSVPVEFFLAMRYLRPRRTFVSVITVLSFLGVTLGVMVLIVVLSVMGGFRANLDARIIGFNAHITVANGDVIYDADKIVALIEKDPGVVAASPIIKGGVLVEHEGRITTAYIKSAPTQGDDPVLPLKKFLVAGDYELLGDSVIVGYQWARQNAAFPGDKIDLFGPSMALAYLHQGEKNHVVVLPDEPIIRGIFKTGQYDYDQNFMLVSDEMAQHLYGIEDNGCQAIAVRLKDTSQAEAVKDRLNDVLPPPFEARTWMDDNRDLFNAIATERVVMTFILFFVMLVAAFGLCSTLITITVQKSREIGLMKALGANDLQVCGVFLFHGVVVGVIGSVFGTISGLVLLHFRNPFRIFLMHAFGIDVFPGSVYGSIEIPAVINPRDVATIAISAVVICVLAALLPAMNAARLAPARALRYE
jgi:lipoprotein-releasing system permease protein